MLLDIQNIFKELRGGLAGLTEVVCVWMSLLVFRVSFKVLLIFVEG